MKPLLSFLFTIILTATLGQDIVDSREREIVIQSVNIVPMDTEQILANQTVIIKNGKITGIGGKLKYGKNALVIDAKGKYLIPGLAEMHAHVPPIDDMEPMKEVFFCLLPTVSLQFAECWGIRGIWS